MVPVLTRRGLSYSERYASSGFHYLRQKARDQLYLLVDDYYKQTRSIFTLVSAYRSYEFQKSVSNEDCIRRRLCAIPGKSEHQAGLAVDLGGPQVMRLGKDSIQYRWLQQHAHIYGRHQTYQHGPNID